MEWEFSEEAFLSHEVKHLENFRFHPENWYSPTVRKKISSDWEKLLKFKTEGQEFANFLRSLEQFIETAKGQNNSW